MVVLSLTVGALTTAHIAANAAWWHELPYSGSAMLFFDMDGETSFPTWVSTILLAWNGLVVFEIAGAVGMRRRVSLFALLALGGTFLFLSADEAVKLHERIAGGIVRDDDPHRSGWVKIWLPMGMLVGAALAVALWRYSQRLVIGLSVGAVVYLTGAAGCELVNQRIRSETEQRILAGEIEDTSRQYDLNHSRRGKNTLPYLAVSTLEESLELAGIVVWSGVVRAGRRDAIARGSATLAA